MENLTDQQILQYAIMEKLGEGGSGQVYRAWDTVQQRLVAVKLLRPQLTETVGFCAHSLSAVNTLSHCSHPNICSILSIHKLDETYLIVMEYLEGATLTEQIRRGPLDNGAFLALAAQIAGGLEYAHQQLITHGNIKPSNIMVIGDGQVKIMDFGLSCYPAEKEVTGIQPSFATLHYLAPERVAGEPVTPAADLFSLGALFYELLTGRRPFIGGTREAVENAILHDKPDFQTMRAKKIPGGTILLVEKLLAKSTADRFSNAVELRITLQEMRSFERTSPKRTFLQVKPQSPRQYLLVSLLTFLLVVLWYVVTTYRH